MMLRQKDRRRVGSILLESALVYPVLFVIVLAIIMLGLGVFRYQQVAHAAREGARWASVHGEKYAKERATTAATPEDVYTNAVRPHLAGAQPAATSYTVTWYTNALGVPDKRPTRGVEYTDSAGAKQIGAVTNTVTVTVTYSWNTILFGTIPVSSTSVTPISY
jgi:Flp pilus assembly protein TadG